MGVGGLVRARRGARVKRSAPLKRGAPLRRTGWLARHVRVNPVNAKRRAKEKARTLGSPERAKFVKGLPCLVCGVTPSENAHLGNGGMSRKSDADQIVPLCGRFQSGHHYELDDVLGPAEFERKYVLELHFQTLAWHAERTDRLWRAFGGEA